MKAPVPFLKIAALSSFVLLMGGFVAYRSGAFDDLFRSSGTFIADPARAAHVEAPTYYPPATDVITIDSFVLSKEFMTMAGSKSMTIISSSKSIIMDFDPPPPDPLAPRLPVKDTLKRKN